MKKMLSIAVIFVMLVTLTLTGVKDATSATLADEIYAKLQKYGATSSDKVRIERYLNDNPATDAQANAIMADVDAAIAVMESEGITDYRELKGEAREKVKALAQAAASEIGLTLSFENGDFQVYKDGKLVDEVSATNTGKLAYTGSNTNTVLVVSSIAVIALAATVVAKKRFAKIGA